MEPCCVPAYEPVRVLAVVLAREPRCVPAYAPVRVLAVVLAREPRCVPACEPLTLRVCVSTGLSVCEPLRALAAVFAAVPAIEPRGVPAPETLALPVCENGAIAVCASVCGVPDESPRRLCETGSERSGDRREEGVIHFIEAKVDIPLTGGSTGVPVSMVLYSFRNNVERKPPCRKARTKRQTSAVMKMTASEM